MQSSSEQPLVGEERYVTTLITAAKEATFNIELKKKARLHLFKGNVELSNIQVSNQWRNTTNKTH